MLMSMNTGSLQGWGEDGDNNDTHGNGEGMGTACRKRCGNRVGMGTKTNCAWW